MSSSSSPVTARASTSTEPLVPSQARVIVPTRNASISGWLEAVAGGVIGAGRQVDAAALDLVEQRREALRQHRDLRLLERDGDDVAAFRDLEEELALAGIADRVGDEPVGRVEDEATSGHVGSTLPRLRLLARSVTPGVAVSAARAGRRSRTRRR